MNKKIEYVGSEGTEFRVVIKPGQVRRFRGIVRAANDEGTIQAGDARDLFSRPEHHTTMSIARALSIAGITHEAV